MSERITIIDFVEKYTHEYADHVFLREKVNGKWTETSFEKTRKEGYRIAGGLMAMGLQKGERVSLFSEGRNDWILSELGILYAGGINVPLSNKLEESNDLTFRINHSESRFVIVSGQLFPKIRNILDKLTYVEKVIVMDSNVGELGEKGVTLEWVRALGDSWLLDHKA